MVVTQDVIAALVVALSALLALVQDIIKLLHSLTGAPA